MLRRTGRRNISANCQVKESSPSEGIEEQAEGASRSSHIFLIPKLKTIIMR
jgi:hypothetical protein